MTFLDYLNFSYLSTYVNFLHIFNNLAVETILTSLCKRMRGGTDVQNTYEAKSSGVA